MDVQEADVVCNDNEVAGGCADAAQQEGPMKLERIGNLCLPVDNS